jgi:hypothetical protein
MWVAGGCRWIPLLLLRLPQVTTKLPRRIVQLHVLEIQS